VTQAIARRLVKVIVALSAMAMAPAFGQARAGARAVLSADTVPLGDVVEVRVSVVVPSGSAVYFPDRLPATETMESRGPVRWEAEAADDGALVRLTYPLIAFGLGNVPIPGFEVVIGPVNRAAGAASLPGGSVIGTWDQVPASDDASTLHASVAPLEVRVASVFELEGVLAGVGPMPAADVLGPDWDSSSVVLVLVSSSALIVMLLVWVTRTRLLSRAGGNGSSVTVVSPLEAGRRAALEELDGLLALGLHTNGRAREFYSMSSAIVHRYVELFDASFSPSLTTTELMRCLGIRRSDRWVEVLTSEMTSAEVVKFGRLRPDVAAAEMHWHAVRRCVEESGRQRS
jgi:hypothetical protein